MLKQMNKYTTIACVSAVFMFISSCKKDEDEQPTPSQPTLEVPDTYEFMRDGNSSVSYSGQTDRLNQLSEIKAVLTNGDAGNAIDEQQLLDMFENTNDNGNGHFSFTSTKQIKSKTFDPDISYFEGLFSDAAAASTSGATASNGQAGLITRASKGSTILVDANGREFTQLVEKGLMGATFLNQIFNSYLTDGKIGSDIDNTNLEDGKNYTALEHHFDEAFGYYGGAIDFSSTNDGSESPRYWAKYSSTVNEHTGSVDKIMTAYRTARAAIVANDHTTKDEQVEILYNELELVAAATAIHYINETLAESDDGDRLHVLSEAYAFSKALRYGHSDYRKLTTDQVDEILDTHIGTNFWETTTTGLNTAKDLLAETYGLNDVKDLL